MHLSAVIVTHRGGPLLEACLASLAAQVRPPDDVCVVVSNVERLPVAGRVVQLGANVGYARAANAGAATIAGELLLLNDDTVLDPGCLAALEAAWAGPGVYQPRILLADGTGRVDNVGHGFFPDGFVWARGRLAAVAPREPRAGGFSGAAALIARETWEALGGFDERFESFCEDVDFSLRLLRRGGFVRAVPDAVVHHHLGATYGRTGADKVRRIERNRVRAAVRSLPLTALLSMPASTGARLALFAGLAARGRGPGTGVASDARFAALAGIADGLRDAPEWWRDRQRDSAGWSRGEWEMWRALWRGRARWEDVCRE